MQVSGNAWAPSNRHLICVDVCISNLSENYLGKLDDYVSRTLVKEYLKHT